MHEAETDVGDLFHSRLPRSPNAGNFRCRYKYSKSHAVVKQLRLLYYLFYQESTLTCLLMTFLF